MDDSLQTLIPSAVQRFDSVFGRKASYCTLVLKYCLGGPRCHSGGTLVSEVRGSRPHVGKLLVSCQWSAVYIL